MAKGIGYFFIISVGLLSSDVIPLAVTREASTPSSGNGWVYFHTPDDGDFRYLSIDLSQKTNIRFRVKACHDANIALSTVKGDPQHQTYEVTLGADDNTRSQIHINEGGEEPVDIATPAILSCNEFRSFWISWEDSINLRIGRGDQPNVNDFMSYQVLKQNFRVNAIGIATKEDTTGEWFVSDIEACETTFMLSGVHSVQKERLSASSSAVGSLPEYSRLYTRSGPYKIKSKNYPDHALFVENENGAHVQLKEGDGTAFFFRSPGLAETEGSISMELSRRPGFYLRHFRSHLYVESNISPRTPHLYNLDSTFMERYEQWYPSYSAFESVNIKDNFLRHRNSEVELDPKENTTIYRNDASYRFAYAAYTGPSKLPLVYYYIGLSVRQDQGLKFSVRACKDAHLALSQNSGVSKKQSYEIVIGGWENTKSAIRTGQYPNGVTRVTSETKDILDCDAFREFWIKWDGGRVRVGSGPQYDDNEIMTWTDTQPHVITDVGIATEAVSGNWRFFTKAGQPKLSWSPKSSSNAEYVSADFGIPIVMKGIMTQGSPKQDNWVSKYRVRYRYDDSSAWQWIDEGAVLDGNTDGDSVKKTMFTASVRARYVRLYPYEWNNAVALRWEVLGCRIEECSPSFLTSGQRPLADSAFTASSWISQNEPREARLFTGRGWVPSALDNEQYLEINLGRVMRVQGIVTQGRKSVREWVENFRVYYYSDASQGFNPYQEPFGFAKDFEGNGDHETPVWNRFMAPFFTNRVRVYPLDHYGRKAMRVEIIGCASELRTAPSQSPGLTGGQKAGIAFLVIFLVVVICCVVFVAISKRRGQDPLERMKELGSRIPNPAKLIKRSTPSSNQFDNPNYSGRGGVDGSIPMPPELKTEDVNSASNA